MLVMRLPGCESTPSNRTYAILGRWRLDWLHMRRWQRACLLAYPLGEYRQRRLLWGFGAGTYDTGRTFSWLPAAFRLAADQDTRVYTWGWFHITWKHYWYEYVPPPEATTD